MSFLPWKGSDVRPEGIFLFNSCLAEHGQAMGGVVQSLGPSINSFRGRNIGNGYISYALLKLFFGGPAKVAHLPNAWEDPLPQSLADQINQTCSHFIFVMQDFIRESFGVLPFQRINEFLEKIQIPVVPMSLGANCFGDYDATLASRLSQQQKRFLSLVSEKSVKIGVRGQYSAEVLGQLGIKNVQITGCPSYFESGATRSLVKRPWNPDRVVTTGAYFNSRLPRSVHLLQDEMYFTDLLFLRGKEDRSDPNAEARPFVEHEIPASFHFHRKAQSGLLRFFLDFRQWERFYEDQDWCLTIGTRLHSAIFSCNRGVPAIVTNGDARARETCEQLGIPHRPDLGVTSNVAEEFENLDLSAMNRKYPALYAGFLEYLKAHGLEQTAVGNDVEHFQFPQVEKPITPQVLETLHSGFSELVEFCDQKIRDGRESEKARQRAQQEAQLRMEDAQRQLRTVESRLQDAEGRLQDAEGRLQDAEGCLQDAESRLQGLETFRASTAGQVVVRLKKLSEQFPKTAYFVASLLRRFWSFRKRHNDCQGAAEKEEERPLLSPPLREDLDPLPLRPRECHAAMGTHLPVVRHLAPAGGTRRQDRPAAMR